VNKAARRPGGENPFLMAGVAGLHPIGDLTLENCYTVHIVLIHSNSFQRRKERENKKEKPRKKMK
jgi:hypothetical protein